MTGTVLLVVVILCVVAVPGVLVWFVRYTYRLSRGDMRWRYDRDQSRDQDRSDSHSTPHHP
jgi:hypothetical protein